MKLDLLNFITMLYENNGTCLYVCCKITKQFCNKAVLGGGWGFEEMKRDAFYDKK